MTTNLQAATVVGVFETVERAEAAVRALLEAGIPRDQVSLVSGHRSTAGDGERTGSEIPENVAGGAIFGGLGGLLLGLAALAVPGMGALVAAGPIATTLAGAGVGAAGGGLVGILKDSGVPNEEASRYTENVRSGRTLVAVHATEADHNRIAELLDSYGAVDIDDESAIRPGARTGEPTERAGITTLGISEPAPGAGAAVVVEEQTPTSSRQASQNEETGMGIGPHTLTPSGFVTRGIENPVVARRRARIYPR